MDTPQTFQSVLFRWGKDLHFNFVYRLLGQLKMIFLCNIVTKYILLLSVIQFQIFPIVQFHIFTGGYLQSSAIYEYLLIFDVPQSVDYSQKITAQLPVTVSLQLSLSWSTLAGLMISHMDVKRTSVVLALTRNIVQASQPSSMIRVLFWVPSLDLFKWKCGFGIPWSHSTETLTPMRFVEPLLLFRR